MRENLGSRRGSCNGGRAMGATKKNFLFVTVATIATWALLQSPLAQNPGKAADAITLAAPKGEGSGAPAPQDAISADADRRAAAAMATTNSEPTSMPIIRGTGNPYSNLSK